MQLINPGHRQIYRMSDMVIASAFDTGMNSKLINNERGKTSTKVRSREERLRSSFSQFHRKTNHQSNLELKQRSGLINGKQQKCI
jgi:hypothetical protein